MHVRCYMLTTRQASTKCHQHSSTSPVTTSRKEKCSTHWSAVNEANQLCIFEGTITIKASTVLNKTEMTFTQGKVVNEHFFLIRTQKEVVHGVNN